MPAETIFDTANPAHSAIFDIKTAIRGMDPCAERTHLGRALSQLQAVVEPLDSLCEWIIMDEEARCC